MSHPNCFLSNFEIEAELLELLELARVGEEKARNLYEIVTAITKKYEHRKEIKQAVAQKERQQGVYFTWQQICYNNTVFGIMVHWRGRAYK